MKNNFTKPPHPQPLSHKGRGELDASDILTPSPLAGEGWGEGLIFPDWPAPKNVRACITTRKGGVSQSPYQQNNFGLHVGDKSADVLKNRTALCTQLNIEKTPQWLEQIHGVKVVQAKSDGLLRTADGSYSKEIGQACVVMTADCLPIFLCDQQGTQVSVLHCGWRSLAKGICERGIKQFSAEPKKIIAYLGPAISQKHFEVGVDVLEAFFKAARNDLHADQIAKAFISAHRPLHFYADIYALARAELTALGVTQIFGGAVDVNGKKVCTFEQQDLFYSYRRDKITGRMASLIWLDNN